MHKQAKGHENYPSLMLYPNPLPLWERVRVRGIFGTKSAIIIPFNPKSAFSPEKAGFDARKPFVLKPLEHAMLKSLPAYFYATQIMQIAA